MSALENIRDKDILPYYKQEDYSNGIARGAYRLAETVAQAEGVSIKAQGTCPPQVASGSSSNSGYPWWIWPLAIILSIFSPRGRGRRFNSGSFGGFGGGGGFGGCGCSGSW